MTTRISLLMVVLLLGAGFTDLAAVSFAGQPLEAFSLRASRLREGTEPEAVEKLRETLGIGQQRAGLHGQQDILQFGVRGVDIVHIIGRHIIGFITRA